MKELGKQNIKLHSAASEFLNMDNSHYDLMKSAIRDMQYELDNKFEKLITQGLKNKGFEFESPNELYEFVKNRCRVFENIENKYKTFVVDDTPFMIYSYKVHTEILNGSIDPKEPYKINANFGGYSFL